MKTIELTKTNKKFIKRVMEGYAESLDKWPRVDGKGRITKQAKEQNHARLIARWKLKDF